MALSDIAATLTTGLPHKTCGTCYALSQMSDEDAAILRGLLSDRGVPFSDIAKELARDPESPTIERPALSRHATGQCSAREYLR
jgi:hypothetical protein